MIIFIRILYRYKIQNTNRQKQKLLRTYDIKTAWYQITHDMVDMLYWITDSNVHYVLALTQRVLFKFASQKKRC